MNVAVARARRIARAASLRKRTRRRGVPVAVAGAVRRLVLLALIGCSSSHVPPLTHTTPLTPTGELPERGHVIRTQSVVSFYHEVALGLDDRLELRFGMPAPPIGIDEQLRMSLLPKESRVRLVIGETLSAAWVNHASAWLGVSATLAWRGDRWGAHATLRAAQRRMADHQELGLATAGVTWNLGHTILFADVGRLSWLDGGDWGAAPGATIGVWFVAKDEARIGFSAMIVKAGDTLFPVGPLLSISEAYY